MVTRPRPLTLNLYGNENSSLCTCVCFHVIVSRVRYRAMARSSAEGGGITFKGFLKASGQAEVWDDTDEKKFSQFGWRTNTSESAYSTNTLIGNWNEERFDLSKLSQTRAPPSQYDHYFSTTYKDGYVKSPPEIPSVLKHSSGIAIRKRTL